MAGVLLISSLFLKILIGKILTLEVDEYFAEMRHSILYHIDRTGSIPIGSDVYNYTFENSVVKDTSEGTHFQTVVHYIPKKQGTRKFRRFVFFTEHRGVFYKFILEKQIEGLRTMTRSLLALTLLTMIFVIGLLLFINKLVLKRLWNPFYQTLATMRNFQLNKENNLVFPKTNIEEFEYMNNILKQTTQKAGRDYMALKEFTENASHELQTPLSIISSKLDILIQDEQISSRQHQTVASAYTALKRMSHLNQSLLLLAKIGNEQFSDLQHISLHEKVKEKAEQFQELWQEQQISVQQQVEEAYININPDLCEILINNLFGNAINHNADSGGFIKIYLTQGYFSVSNSGQNFPLDQQKLFRRFYKSDKSAKSNGLGLSIIKHICDASNINIHYTFENNTHTFHLTWTV